jgi:dephospho-CoA kinase
MSGKSGGRGHVRRVGVPVHDSNAVVHRILGPWGAAVAAVVQQFPGTLAKDGGIDHDRQVLARAQQTIDDLHRVTTMIAAVAKLSQQTMAPSKGDELTS